MKNTSPPEIISSISEQHRRLRIAAPNHPLVSVFRFEALPQQNAMPIHHFAMDFYCVALKKNFKGKLKYGQRYYDFDEGVMSFISPQQVLTLEEGESATNGWSLSFHPDLIAGTALANKIKGFGFFSYSLSEALHLSDKEEATVESLIKSIEQELGTNIDHLSHEIIVSQLELLLNYSNRFYKRQFITRSVSEHEVLIRMEGVLSKLFENGQLEGQGVPTVQEVAAQMNVSPGYLSDMLRTLTGQNTQQHIHSKLIEKAKEKLSTTSLSVSEIAYQLGFEHPQSFNRLFKSKTQLSPLEYRQSVN